MPLSVCSHHSLNEKCHPKWIERDVILRIRERISFSLSLRNFCSCCVCSTGPCFATSTIAIWRNKGGKQLTSAELWTPEQVCAVVVLCESDAAADDEHRLALKAQAVHSKWIRPSVLFPSYWKASIMQATEVRRIYFKLMSLIPVTLMMKYTQRQQYIGWLSTFLRERARSKQLAWQLPGKKKWVSTIMSFWIKMVKGNLFDLVKKHKYIK